MEPELFALARRMYEAFASRRMHDGGSEWVTWDANIPRTWRAFLAAAIVARPDLAAGLSVPAGHWAHGALTLSPVVRESIEFVAKESDVP